MCASARIRVEEPLFVPSTFLRVIPKENAPIDAYWEMTRRLISQLRRGMEPQENPGGTQTIGVLPLRREIAAAPVRMTTVEGARAPTHGASTFQIAAFLPKGGTEKSPAFSTLGNCRHERRSPVGTTELRNKRYLDSAPTTGAALDMTDTDVFIVTAGTIEGFAVSFRSTTNSSDYARWAHSSSDDPTTFTPPSSSSLPRSAAE